jgi:guanine nucleotide-binding protein G(I)/G(S)/G(T) subunit beta-1
LRRHALSVWFGRWDTLGDNLKAYGTFEEHENKVSCLGLHPSGKALCTGSWDTMLRLYG